MLRLRLRSKPTAKQLARLKIWQVKQSSLSKPVIQDRFTMSTNDVKKSIKMPSMASIELKPC